MKPAFYTRIIISFIFSITLYSCKTTNTNSTQVQEKSLNLTPVESPVKLSNSQNKFYKDISYGPNKDNVFDILFPVQNSR